MEFIYIVTGIVFVPAIAAGFIKNKMVKGGLSFLSLVGFFVLSVLLAAFVLPNFIGVHSVWLPFILCGAAFIVCMLFVWKPFSLKTRRIAALSAVSAAILLTAVFAGPVIYQNAIPEAPGEEINLLKYMPFGDSRASDNANTLAVTLNEESTLKLHDNLPRLDGATALYPLYAAFVRAAYPEGEYFPYYDLRGDGSDYQTIVSCSATIAAFENLIDGYADVIFLMGVSDKQREMAEAKGVELQLTPIGREAFVFFVNSRNASANLSTEDIQRIYSGEAANWRDVGGQGGKIKAYQRPDESGSQTMLKQIMGGAPLVPAPQEDIYDTMMGMYKRVADYKNFENSLGYSFLFYISGMINENKVKFLSIDGVAPTRENIANGAYPFANDFYAITAQRGGAYSNAARIENINKLIGWTLSPQGQYLVEATGYVPVES
ncbi:MAG: substrate-binding domain-containing protein [Clostridiales bacterium]|nr:substrate-binding domain-containing protein [Clostridiales bacterium]